MTPIGACADAGPTCRVKLCGQILHPDKRCLSKPVWLFVFLLALSISLLPTSARAMAYVVLESEFRAAYEDFPECALEGHQQTATRVLDFSPQLKIIQQNDGIYCIAMKWTPSDTWQRLHISGSFWQMFVSDVMSEKRAPFLILFVGDLFETIAVAMVEGRFVVIGQCCQLPEDIHGALGAPAIVR